MKGTNTKLFRLNRQVLYKIIHLRNVKAFTELYCCQSKISLSVLQATVGLNRTRSFTHSWNKSPNSMFVNMKEESTNLHL